ncbi:hypothetical protein ATANTOWER_024799 [Ataeniobius toweri]|uniref:Uncharacterized protein n=1 Tax=Ataeniobius toweri TaxID=208326 RepID=A0ABU7BUC2_9TELE|nr:hypothetical protein [Ataeniobius toweri]
MKITGFKQNEDRTDGCLDKAIELNTFSSVVSVQKQAQHPFLLPTAKKTSHLPMTHSFPVTPQMSYLPRQPWTHLILHVCLQPNQKMLKLPLPPPSTCLSQEVK